MRSAEAKAGLGEALTAAAARSYHRLLAVKDEWEVARLFAAPEFAKALPAEFEGPFKLHFHLGGWPFGRPDPRTGVMGKGEAGPWAMTAFRLMARLRFLRGTMLDPFRNSDERKLERRLIAEFEADIDDLVQRLAPGNHALAVRIAGLPETIKGYGRVKEASAAEAAKAPRERAAAVAGRQGADGAGRMTMDGKTIVVTGGFGALGSAVAEAAAQRGASVAALDYAASAPPGSPSGSGRKRSSSAGSTFPLPQPRRRAMAEVTARFGRIDALLNIAGGFQWEKIGRGQGGELGPDVRHQPEDGAERVAARASLSSRERRRPHRQRRRAVGGSRAPKEWAPMRRASPPSTG